MDFEKMCKLKKICLEKRENEFSGIILELIDRYIDRNMNRKLYTEEDMNRIEKEDMGYDR